jgi:hypothetical protein
MMCRNFEKWGTIITGIVLITACNSQTVRTTQIDPIAPARVALTEEQLLDVGINVFDPGIDNIDEDKGLTTPAVREAESRYMAYTLSQTLQQSGQWGAVRVIPDRQSETDVWVDGKILESTGERLKIQVTVQDASGRTWYTRTYEEEVSKYAYDRELRHRNDAFQGLYNRVANDMQAYLRKLKPEELQAVRTISRLKFAGRFSPEAFGDHLEDDGRGNYQIKRLPAANDPILERVERIRERDHMFVDTLQDHYGSFSLQMRDAYDQWRQETYFEAQALRELKQQQVARTLGGALAIVGGILAAGSDSGVTRAAGAVGIGAGAYMIKSGIDKGAEAKIHAETLKELAASLDTQIEPHNIELEERTVTLTGTVEQQYAQWRAILLEIYQTETGQQPLPDPQNQQ